MYQLAGVPRVAGPRRRWPVVAGAGDHRRHRAAPGARPVPGLLPGGLRHVQRARPGHRRLVRRPGLDPRHRRLALDLLVNVPIGVVALAVVSGCCTCRTRRREHRIDWPGALALVVGLVPLLIVAEQGRIGAGPPRRARSATRSAPPGWSCSSWPSAAYGDDALLPLRLFRNRTFAVSVSAASSSAWACSAASPLLPQYLQIVHGATPTVRPADAAAVAGIMIGSISSGQLIARTGRYKLFPVVGTSADGRSRWSSCPSLDVDTPFWAADALMRLGRRPRLQHAAAHPGRAERCRPRGRWAWPPHR